MATRLINNLGEGGLSSCVIVWAVGFFIRALVLNSSRQTFWRLAGESCGTTNMVISGVAYRCTIRQKTGSNISLFSVN